MTLTFISWCSFATNILFWLQIAVPILACDILDETSDYFYFFGYQLLLYFVSGFWYGLSDGLHGVNLVRRQVHLNSTEIYTRAVRREIIFRGMTQLYRAGLTSDRYLLSPGPACVFVFLLANVTCSKVVPVGVRFFTWLFDSSVKPIYDYARRKVKKPPDGYLTQLLCFNLICLAFARFGFTVYARILGVRLGIIKLAGTSRRRKLSRKIARRRPWISSRRKTRSFGKLRRLLILTMLATATKKQSNASHAHATTDAHQLEASTVTFDSDAVTFVMDNAATGHICNDKKLFEGPLSKDSSSGVITANGVTTHMQGNVRLNWFDDEHVEHEHLLTEVH